MTLQITRNHSLTGFEVSRLTDPTVVILNSTMMGGTSLLEPAIRSGTPTMDDLSEYVAVRLEEILEYERTILELQRELLHYKRLLAKHLPQTEVGEEYSRPVLPLDPASVRVIDSVLAASVPRSAIFTDFEEGEL